jgi:uncharacterized protein (TIGR02466 family)
MNTNEKLISLFPKPLLIIENVFLDKLSYIEGILKEEIKAKGFKRTASHNVNTTYHTDNKLFENKNLKFLTDFIFKSSINFLNNLNYDEYYIKNCKYYDMWFNISYENDFLFPHHHGVSLVSGVYYVKAPKDSYINFFNHQSPLVYHNEKFNPHTADEAKINCIEGNLMLFKSDLIHGNKLQPKGEKIAISFNLGI